MGQVVEQDHALAAEAAGEQDEDGARLQAGARFGGVDGFTDLERREEGLVIWTR